MSQVGKLNGNMTNKMLLCISIYAIIFLVFFFNKLEPLVE